METMQRLRTSSLGRKNDLLFTAAAVLYLGEPGIGGVGISQYYTDLASWASQASLELDKKYFRQENDWFRFHGLR